MQTTNYIYISYWTFCFFNFLGSAYLTYKFNQDKQMIYGVIAWGISVFPLWPLGAYISTNILRDALIFDTMMLFVYSFTYLYLTQSDGKGINSYQLCGILFTLFGLMLFKFGENI